MGRRRVGRERRDRAQATQAFPEEVVKGWAKEGEEADWHRLTPPRGFRVLPRRWVVQRAFARICHDRRMAKDHEKLCATGGPSSAWRWRGLWRGDRLVRRSFQTCPRWPRWAEGCSSGGLAPARAGRCASPPRFHPNARSESDGRGVSKEGSRAARAARRSHSSGRRRWRRGSRASCKTRSPSVFWDRQERLDAPPLFVGKIG